MVETSLTLLERVRNRDDAASWQEFHALYEPLLMRYVCSQGLDADDARDVVQDIFALLVRRLPEFHLDPARGRFRTWLWRVAHNAVVDSWRRRDRRRNAETQWGREQTIIGDGGFEDRWNREYDRHVLSQALIRVREDCRPSTWSAFEGHILQARPAVEVAAELGMSTGAVYVAASRLLERVRQQCRAYLLELDRD